MISSGFSAEKKGLHSLVVVSDADDGAVGTLCFSREERVRDDHYVEIMTEESDISFTLFACTSSDVRLVTYDSLYCHLLSFGRWTAS